MIRGNKKNTGDFLWALAGRGGAAGLQALTLVLLARLSSPADFGLTMGAQGVLLTVAYFLGFGLGPYVIVEQSKSRYSDNVSQIVYVNNRTSLFAGLLCLVGLVTAGLLSPQLFVLLPLAIAMLAMRNSAVLEGIALANGRVRIFGASLLLRRLIQVLAFGLLAVTGFHPLIAYSVAYAVSEVAINIVLRRVVGKVPAPLVRPSIGRVVKGAASYWIETVAVQFRGLDVSSAGLLGGSVVGGMYAVPARLSSAILMVPSTFANLCLPRIAAGNRRTFKLVAAASIPVIILVLGVLGVLALYAEWIIRLLLGDDYISAAGPTRVFCIGFAILTCITVANAMVQGIGLAKHVAWTSMVGAILIVGLVGAGAASYGAVGSSWGYTIAVTLQFLLLAFSSTPGVIAYLKRED